MATVVRIKPITATTVVSDEKYINEIKESVLSKPTIESRRKNRQALELLRKARRG